MRKKLPKKPKKKVFGSRKAVLQAALYYQREKNRARRAS